MLHTCRPDRHRKATHDETTAKSKSQIQENIIIIMHFILFYFFIKHCYAMTSHQLMTIRNCESEGLPQSSYTGSRSLDFTGLALEQWPLINQT